MVVFARPRFDYNLLTFKPIPCIDPHFIVEERESPLGEKPVQMPSYEIGSQAFDDEKEEEKNLKLTMLNKCHSISKRMKACVAFKKMKEEELDRIISIQEEDRSRLDVEDGSPSIQEKPFDLHNIDVIDQ